jgi:hypothetical protein
MVMDDDAAAVRARGSVLDFLAPYTAGLAVLSA